MADDLEIDPLLRAVGRKFIGPALVAGIPQFQRGVVWCKSCGRPQTIDALKCMKSEWPKCHGETMTIDSPEERAAQTKGDNDG